MGRLDLANSWGRWSPLGAASMGAGWHSCYLGQGIKAYSLSCGSLGSQEFWKLGHELQKHLASQMGWTPGNSAQAVSLQTLKGLWEVGRCQALLMAGPAQAGACPLPLQQKGKAKPLQIYSQSSAPPSPKESLFHRGMTRGTHCSSLSHRQTDRHTFLSSSNLTYSVCLRPWN